ncbi:MAG: hypothetical protein N2511_02615 [Thermodesulfovibrionales bacterium]|nr:hypothetical protein [Thermodesulfovibrionales bacterium]
MVKFVFLIIISLIFSLYPCELFAHRVNIYAYMDSDSIKVEGYFSDGSKCKNCEIEVFDRLTNKIIITGKTDNDGLFSFKKSNVDSQFLKIILKAGVGHRAFFEMNLKESPKTEKGSENIASDQNKRFDHNKLRDIKCLTQQEVETIINEAVDKKIHIFTEQVVHLQKKIDRRGTIEIIGGIGYIIGVLAVIMYLKSKKTKN